MSLPAWPAFAIDYHPLNEDYAVQLPDLVNRTDFEQGLSRQRQIFTSGPVIYQVTWPMTPAQMNIFEGWRKNALGGGNCWFLIPVFWPDTYVTRQARFVKNSIQIKRQGGEWIVSAQIELAELPTLSDTDTAVAMLTYGTSQTVDQLVTALHTAVHTTLPAALP